MIERLPKGTRYYFVNTRMKTTSNIDYGDRDMDATKRFEAGNYFYSEYVCERYASICRKMFKIGIKEITIEL